ncbi:Ca2+-dependent phosphoinositide-specific phospholipase C, partial [Thermodesulfobacteriota bacterium]
ASFHGCGDDGHGPSSPLYPNDDALRINQIQCLGTHNSFHTTGDFCGIPFLQYSHEPLDVQMEMGVRKFELDIHYNRGESLKVYHIPFVDFRTTCEYFVGCLSLVKEWSDGHPGHHLLFVIVEPKDDFDADKFTGHMAEIDDEILSVWPLERIFTPDDLIGDGPYDTLIDAVLDRGWPLMGAVRDHIMFVLWDSGALRDEYVAGDPTMEGRVMFPRGGLDKPYGGFTNIDDPVNDDAAIDEAVAAGLIVRTRADANCIEAYFEDYSRQEAALASGAQIITTDFPAPPKYSDYWFDLPDGTPSRCNPLTAPGFCTPRDIENLPDED